MLDDQLKSVDSENSDQQATPSIQRYIDGGLNYFDRNHKILSRESLAAICRKFLS